MIKKGRKAGGARMSAFDSLKGDIDPLAKRIVVMAILTAELEKEGFSPVVAGDYAVELYTSGEYNADCIEMVAPAGAAEAVLACLDFSKDNGIWVNSDIEVRVRISGENLDDSQLQRVNQIDVNGASVYLIGLEDTVVSKLKGFAETRDLSATAWAQELVEAHVAEIDWEYLKGAAKMSGAMDALQGIIDELGIEEEEDDKYKAKF